MVLLLKILFLLPYVVITSCPSRSDTQEQSLKSQVFGGSFGWILKEKFLKRINSLIKVEVLFRIEPDIYQAEDDSLKTQLEQVIAEFGRADRDRQRIRASYEDRIASKQ